MVPLLVIFDQDFDKLHPLFVDFIERPIALKFLAP
jgi:hypothetical protein